MSSANGTVSGVANLQLAARTYLLPVLILISLSGNTLNLFVLNSKTMRTKTNVLLSGLALSDLLCMLFQSCNYLYGWFKSVLEQKMLFELFVAFYFLSNWFSAAGIWFTLAVTVERALAIRAPLHNHLSHTRLICIIVSILILTFGLTFYANVWISLVPIESPANITSYRSVYVTKMQNASAEDARLATYVNTSIILAAVLVVLGPMLALICLNYMLVCAVKQSHKAMHLTGKQEQDRTIRERKVTIMICVIVASFIILNLPSAMIHLWDIVDKSQHNEARKFMSVISNYLVLTNKAINFFLYCMSSETFRQKAWLIIRCKKASVNSRSSMAKPSGPRYSNYSTQMSEVRHDNSVRHRNAKESQPSKRRFLDQYEKLNANEPTSPNKEAQIKSTLDVERAQQKDSV